MAEFDDVQALGSIQLWRIFVISESFREITFSCLRGLGVVRYLVTAFMGVFYSYAYVAHVIFHNIEEPDEGTDFSSFSISCLTMMQVFMGEVRAGLMVIA